MPLYNIATYTSVREEWAIHADSMAHARTLIGDEPSGAWLDAATLIESEPLERRDEFASPDENDVLMIEEISPDHWAWETANRGTIQALQEQNVAAISVEFHGHWLYQVFYDRFGERLNGFTGIFDYCISIAGVLTAWEVQNGLTGAYEEAGLDWIDVVEDFISTILERALAVGVVPDSRGSPARNCAIGVSLYS